MSRTYYRLAPGTDVIPVAEAGVVFQSAGVRLRLDGASARFFAERVVPLLDGTQDVGAIAESIPEVSERDLRSHLDALADARVLTRSDAPASSSRTIASPFFDFLQSAGLPLDRAVDRLASMRIAVLGLEGAGAQVADALARAGVGTLLFADPGPCRPDDLGLMSLLPVSAAGRPRHDALADQLLARDDRLRVERLDADLTRDAVESFTEGADFLVSCFDRDFAAANHWVNHAAFAHRTPAIFAQLQGHRALAGPLVIPNETPCYMCARMRTLACAEDFEEAMATEEQLDARRAFAPAAPPAMPGVVSLLAGLVSTEILKAALAVGTPSHCASITEYDALSARFRTHPFLERPDCPVCQKKKTRVPPPALAE